MLKTIWDFAYILWGYLQRWLTVVFCCILSWQEWNRNTVAWSHHNYHYKTKFIFNCLIAKCDINNHRMVVLQRRIADTMEFINKNIMVEHCQNPPRVCWQMNCHFSHVFKQITGFTTWQSHKQCVCKINAPKDHFISSNAVRSNGLHPQIPPFKWNIYLNSWPSWHSQGTEQISTNCSLKKNTTLNI